MQVSVLPLSGGQAGILETAHVMASVARSGSTDPVLHRVAGRVTQGCAATDRLCRTKKLQSWIARAMVFTPDPLGSEHLDTPSAHIKSILKSGRAFGDCDDAATLSASMLLSVGVPARFAVASFRPDRRLHHVWAEANVSRDGESPEWWDLDPFRSERFVSEATQIVYVRV